MKTFYLFISVFTLITGSAFAQSVVSGKVTSNEDKLGMPGVNVVVKGTGSGTVTNADGTYSIDVPAGSVLVFSFVGFESQELSVGSQQVLDVLMMPDLKQLEEVVISGYREETRRALVGSVSVIKSDKIQNVPIATFDQILQGRVPGMLVSSGSGQPGTAANVIIRGVKSVTGTSAPLYIMDGVPITPAVFNTLNPNDFENVSVLKDATASAIYGSRGANGVIVITTKKGKPGDTQINYGFQTGISYAPQNRLQVMNTAQKIDFELATGGSSLSTMSSEEINRLKKINTNWQDVLFRTARTVQHDLSIQGGNDKTTFFISGSYFDQEGTVKNTGLKRYSAKFNLQHEANRLHVGLNTTFGYSKNQTTLEGNSYIGSPLNAVRWSNPYESPYDANGDYTVIKSGQPNALQELLENHNRFSDIKAIINAYAEYTVPKVEGLTVKTSWGTDFTQRDGDTYFDRTTYTGKQTPGQAGSQGRSSSMVVNFVGTNSVSYQKSFDNVHEIYAAAYHEVVYTQNKGFNFTGYGLTSNLKNDGGITVSPTYLPTLGGSNSEKALQSYFADVSYAYDKKYYVKAGYRRDQSSVFGKNFQTANFYSVGLNWRITEETFFKNLNLSNQIDFLKVYSNLGTSGNQNVDGGASYPSLALYSPAFTYDGSAGIRQIQPDNPNLSWETVRSFNAGIEYSLLKSRITGSIEYYTNETINLFLATQLSRTSGYATLSQNVGRVQNKGIEIDINATVLKYRAFTWNVNANFTYNENKVLTLPNGEDIVNGLSVIREGLSLGTNYVVRYAGVNPANGDALYYKKDGSLTNQFSSDDLVPMGTRIAPRFGGFTNTFDYKGLSLSVFFSWVQGNQVFNNDRTNVENPTYYVDNLAVSLLRAWKKPGDITDVPRIQTTGGLTTNAFQSQTSRYIEDGSFLRLRNVMLSYNVPAKWTSKAKLRSVRVFVQGQNLWTSFKFQGWDPELAAGTLVGAQYPALRTITGGINVGF